LSLLKVEDIHTYYGRSYILQGASLEVNEREVVALLGRNGAGKTTTLKTIMGLVKPKTGRVFFKDTDITRLPAFKVARRGIGYAPQGRQLFPKMTVLENLKTGMKDPSDMGSLDGIFDLFPVLRERLGQLAGTLSGGEQQMLVIGRSLMSNPKLLMLDEPSLGLMPKLVDEMLEAVAKLKGSGKTILLVEQNVREALELSDRGYVLQTGRTIHQGTGKELLTAEIIQKAFLGL